MVRIKAGAQSAHQQRGGKRLVALTGLVASSIFMRAVPVTAQQCGWGENAFPASVSSIDSLKARLPPDVEGELEGSTRAYLRWVATCDMSVARRAIDELGRMATSTNDPWVWELHAVLLARGPDVQVPAGGGLLFRATYLNSNAEREAVDIWTRKLPNISRWSAVELAALALGTRSSTSLRAAEVKLSTEVQEDLSLWPILAEIQLARAEYTKARATALRFGAEGDGHRDRILGIVEMSEGPDAETGALAYLNGIDRGGGELLSRYYEDITPVLSPDEVQQWADVAAEHRAEWLKRAWLWRATIASISPARRIIEHFRRVKVALKDYRRLSFRPASFAALWTGSEEPSFPFDDRGLVIIRHGEPDEIVRDLKRNRRTGGQSERQAWLYRRISGTRAILEFERTGQAPDYFLADPYVRGCEHPDLGPPSDRYLQQIEAFLWTATANRGRKLDSVCYLTIAGDTAGGKLWWSGHSLRSTVAHAVFATESAEPRYRVPVDLLVNSYAVKTGQQFELVTFGFIRPDARRDRARYPEPMTLVTAFENPVERISISNDTVVRIPSGDQLAPGAMVTIRTHLFLTSSDNGTIRMRAASGSDPQRGQIVVIPRALPSSLDLDLSDLVVAGSTGGSWRRGGVALAPLPAHGVPANSAFRLYFEAYQKSTERVPGQLSVTIAPRAASGIMGTLRHMIRRREAMQIHFTEDIAEEMTVFDKQIQVDLAPGDYVLSVQLTTPDGRSASRTTSLYVFEPQ